MIYESRPNVTIEAASLALKSGNAIIPLGSKRFILTKHWLRASNKGLQAVGLPEAAVQVVENHRPRGSGELITMNRYVDVIVPRGGKA